MDARWWTRLTGRVSRLRIVRVDPASIQIGDKHEKRIERSCRLGEPDHSKKKSNFPWRRGRGGCNRFRSIPSPCSNELTGGIVSYNAGDRFERSRKRPFSRRHHQPCHTPPSTSCYSSRPDAFASTVPPSKKRGINSGRGGYRCKREREKKYQIFPIIDVSRARAVEFLCGGIIDWRFFLWHVWRDSLEAFDRRYLGTIFGNWWKNWTRYCGSNASLFSEFNFIWN